MRVRPSIWSAAAFGMIAIVATPKVAKAALSDFNGSWQRDGRALRGVTRIDLRSDGNRVFVHVWAQCDAKACDWGEVPVNLYGSDTRFPLEKTADQGMAVFESNGVGDMLLLRPQGSTLTIQIFTNFADGSARSNYDGTWTMKAATSALSPAARGGSSSAAQVIFQNENVSYNQGDRISLRNGIAQSDRDWDFTLVGATQPLELNLAGAKGVIVSTDEPDYGICSSRGYTNDNISIEDISGGNWLCVKMRDGSFGKLKLNDFDGWNSASFSIAVWAHGRR
jgi:hypothetical protein